MSFGAWQKFSKTFPSGGTTISGGFDLGRAYQKVYALIPANLDNTLYQQVAPDGSTFYRVTREASTHTASPTDYAIASNTTSRIVPLLGGHRHLNLEAATAVSGDFTVQLLCGD